MDYVNSAKQGIQNNLPSLGQNAQQGLATIQSGLSSIRDQVSSTLQGFGSAPDVGQNSSAEYLTANTLIARFVFLIIVLIIFLFLLNLGINLIGYFLNGSGEVYVVKGLHQGSAPYTVSQNRDNKDHAIIYRSSNEKSGIEFTWSTWLNVDKIANSGSGGGISYQHIFNKGNNVYDANTGIATVNNAPGLYLDKNTNALKILMDVISPIDGSQKQAVDVDIQNIPLKKWFHLAIRLQNHILDVYVNGVITVRQKMEFIPKQNYDDIHLCQSGGFAGNISNLKYYPRALTMYEINNLMYNGPNTTSVAFGGNAFGVVSSYDYLSAQWYKNILGKFV